MILWEMLALMLFIFIAFFPANIAASKGRNFFLWWLISIPFWWITLFVALSLKDDTKANVHSEE